MHDADTNTTDTTHKTKRDRGGAGRERALRSDAKASREALVAAARQLFAERGPELLEEPRGFAERIQFFVHYFQEHPDIARLWMFHLLAGQSRSREGWKDYIASLAPLAESPHSLPGIDAEMLGVIGLTSSLVWSVMASQQDEEAAMADTDRFAAELQRLFLKGTRKPGHLPPVEGDAE